MTFFRQIESFNMNKGLSVYLDLIRSSAAMLVFIHHLLLNFGCYPPGTTNCQFLGYEFPKHAGHGAVVLFFSCQDM